MKRYRLTESRLRGMIREAVLSEMTDKELGEIGGDDGYKAYRIAHMLLGNYDRLLKLVRKSAEQQYSPHKSFYADKLKALKDGYDAVYAIAYKTSGGGEGLSYDSDGMRYF